MGVRSIYWLVTYNILKENPFGAGLGDFENVVAVELLKDKYKFLTAETKTFMSHMHPHNQYLLILLQMGVIGIVLFIYFIYQIFNLKIKNIELKQLSILFILIYTIGFFGEPLLNKQFTLSLFALFIGLFIVDIEITKN